MRQKLTTGLLNGIALFVLLYIILKARFVPMTVDEVSTCINHVPRTVWEILTYAGDATPNNHVLNTLMIKGLTWLLGMHHVVVRIPVLIGASLYIWATLKLAQRLPGIGFQICAFLLLIGNPYMLEFMGLARGYGLGIGLMAVAIWQAVRYMETIQIRSLAMALLFAFLAVTANFTLLNFYVPFIFLFSIVVFQKDAKGFWRANWLIPVSLIVTMLFCYLPITRMRATDQFQFWHNNGFFQDTLNPLVSSSTLHYDFFGGKSTEWLVGLAVLCTVGCWMAAIVGLLRAKGKFSDTVFITGVFAGSVVFNLLNVFVLKTPFLDSRTALFFYPLFALQLIVAAQWLWSRWGMRLYLYIAPIALFAIVNTVRSYNIQNSYQWWFDGGTFEVLDYFKETYERERPDKPYTLDCKWVMQNSLSFHIQHSTPHYEPYINLASWHDNREYPRNTEFFVTESGEDVQALINEYDIVVRVPRISVVLMRKKKDLQPNQ